ncbi:MAG: hypothetical protein Fur0037_05170 [Planctomycetota bacterium]
MRPPVNKKTPSIADPRAFASSTLFGARSTLARRGPSVPAVHASVATYMSSWIGETMRPFHAPRFQTSFQVPHFSRCTFDRPSEEKRRTPHSQARVKLSEPVRRCPMAVRSVRISMA